MKIRKIRKDEVTFSLHVEQEDMAVRGNALASGDDVEDKKVEDEILRRLDKGDVWAWAWVKVTASLELPDGTIVEEYDSLGGCSYADEKDFKQGGYYDDMCDEALARIQSYLEAAIARGEQFAKWFAPKPRRARKPARTK